jgi:hypothetical protein
MLSSELYAQLGKLNDTLKNEIAQLNCSTPAESSRQKDHF